MTRAAQTAFAETSTLSETLHYTNADFNSVLNVTLESVVSVCIGLHLK